MTDIVIRWLVLFIVAAALTPVRAAGTPAQRRTSAGDLFASGGKIELRDAVAGDAFLAGGRVSLDGAIAGDAFVIGGNVSVNQHIDQDLYAVGGNIVIGGDIAHHVRAAGGDITIAPNAKIGGKATLAGAHVDVKGAVGSHLSAAAESVEIDASIKGNVELSARDVDIGPHANIGGTLTYWSAQQARIDPAAKIAGAIHHREVDMPRGMHRMGIAAIVIGSVFVFLACVVLGGLLLLLLPDFTGTVERAFERSPGKSFLLGLAVLLALPIVGVLFMLTIIGIPLGLMLLFFYPLVLMIGYVTAAFFIGDHTISALRKGKPLTAGYRILGLVAALMLLALLQALPIVGGAIAFVVVLMGLGAWAISLYNRYHGAAAA
jgi:cytoskeletal protein CcmA (bactofilin family)